GAQSVVHRGRRSQTNGWAQRHHSSTTFFAIHEALNFALHGWLTGQVRSIRVMVFCGIQIKINSKNPYHIDRDSNKSLFKVKRGVFSISDP
ncbi:hypothetical protein, partial [Peribacillus frigoritolerans]|uniref:hypothetical protein n=1 Tax=Peribacillus frigoritolerans TaxID=450367 RepID=UPI002E1FAF29|nr:hypothetical protein [Peribacillus frigoritolerans]